MQIAILHLSDIHIKTSADPILLRGNAIRGAFHEAAPNATACLVVISGDAAFSGLAVQYDLAYEFLDGIREQLMGLRSVNKVEFVVVTMIAISRTSQISDSSFCATFLPFTIPTSIRVAIAFKP